MKENYIRAVKAPQERLSQAQEHYLAALRHFLAVEEAPASLALNSARNAVLRGRAASTASTFNDEDAQAIMPDLTVQKFNLLYGDYKSEAKSPWNLFPETLTMVGRHISQLGNMEDSRNFARFVQTHAPKIQKRFTLVIS